MASAPKIPPPPPPIPEAPIKSPYSFDLDGKIKRRKRLKRSTIYAGNNIDSADLTSSSPSAKNLLGE